MFAYGRAGSGKTYTVGSAAPGAEESPHRSIIPSAISEIFDRREGEGPSSESPCMHVGRPVPS